nr:FAD-dependent oxidoreductase [Azotobacter chroococcum]
MRRNRTTHGHYRFVMGTVTGVDLETRQVRAETLAGLQALSFEHLVLAFGTRTNLALVPGMAKHALPLKLVGDALFIRNRVLQRVARIELESDPQLRRCLGHFVVVGGGFSGVEVAGGLADFLRGALRYYPRVKPDELRGTILQDGARLLPELPEAAATVICTIGTRPHRLVEQLGVLLVRGLAAHRAVRGGPGRAARRQSRRRHHPPALHPQRRDGGRGRRPATRSTCAASPGPPPGWPPTS